MCVCVKEIVCVCVCVCVCVVLRNYTYSSTIYYFQAAKSVNICSSEVCRVLIDTERTLALLQGLRACFMVQSIPFYPEDEENDKWLSMEVFSSGCEIQPLSSVETHLSNKPMSAEMLARSFQRQTSITFDAPRSFICGLMNPDIQDEKVAMFLSLVHRYCRQHHLVIALCDQNPDHPVEKFGRLFMACLMKLHDLAPVALSVLEQEGAPNNEQDSTLVRMPASLTDICKLVYDAKVSLVKAHQESSCTYEEVCRDPISRCCFILDNIRSPMMNIINILHKNRIQNGHSRWKRAAQRVMEHEARVRQTAAVGKGVPGSPLSADVVSEGIMERMLQGQHSVDMKQQVSSVMFDDHFIYTQATPLGPF